MGGARELTNLRERLFKDYSPEVRPAFDYSKPTAVKVDLYYTALLGLDIKEQVLHLHGFLYLRWTDELLTWNASDYGGIDQFTVPQNKVWKPDIVFRNAVDEHMFAGSENTLVTVNSMGYIRWDPVFDLMTSCELDISKYPFEVNTCFVYVQAWMNANTSVKIIFKEESQDIVTSYVENGEFKLSDAGRKVIAIPYIYDGKQQYFEIAKFLYRVERLPLFLCLSLLIPITLIAVLCVLSFILPPDDGEKLTVSITVLLAFTVFLEIINENLPDTSVDISYLVVYVTGILIEAFVCVMGNAVVLYIYRREIKHQEAEQLAHNAKSSLARSLQERFPQSDISNVRPDHTDNDATVTDDLLVKSHPNPRRFWTKHASKNLNRILLVSNTAFLLIFTAWFWIRLMT